ncbi:MAG: SulP family inorganic anion transporter [Turneriella sp.]
MKAFNDLKTHWRSDLTAGFILSLIALPLCIGIAGASIGNGSLSPAVSGLIAAVTGGVLVSRLSGTHVAIHGPAAGLIVIVQHGIDSLGAGDARLGFQRFLAAMIIAGALQILTGLLKLARYAALFPVNVIHGMLAAIGVIIISKQVHIALGVTPQAKSPLGLYAEVPASIGSMNPEIAVIGFTALGVMVFFLLAPWQKLKRIPAPLVAVIAAAVLGVIFDLQHEHHYFFMGRDYVIGENYLVTLPVSVLTALPRPDFSAITSPASLVTIFATFFVASLESLLSASAVDKLDHEKRVSDLNREIMANGVANMLLGAIGGLPIIAEIVRSSANVSNGAKTQWSNFFHGLFLALYLFLIPGVIHLIPNAALAGILILVGFRLARPSEFKHAFEAGSEQLTIFLTTLVVTLIEDLLVGIAAGLVVKVLILVLRGVKLREVFRLRATVQDSGPEIYVKPEGSIIFTNLFSLTDRLASLPKDKQITLDFSAVHYIDHTSMAALVTLKQEADAEGRTWTMNNIDLLKPYSSHPASARRA